MVAMHEEHVGFGEDLADIQVPVLGSDDRDAELDLPRVNEFVDPPHRLIMELHRYVGTLLGELPQDRRKVVIGDGRQTGERQRVLFGVAAFAKAVICLGEECKVAPNLGKQRLPFFGQQDVTRAADQQLHAEIGLDFPDAMTERGLRQVEIVRRAVETAQLCDSDERFQPKVIRPHKLFRTYPSRCQPYHAAVSLPMSATLSSVKQLCDPPRRFPYAPFRTAKPKEKDYGSEASR
jgi:hypothetical protein